MSMNFDGELKPLICGKGRTKQSFRDAADINTIVARYRKTGMLENLSRAQPYYADVSTVGTYADNLRKVTLANESFMMLPAALRERFENDPGQLMDFIADEANTAEAIELGILAKPLPAPGAVVPVDPVKGSGEALKAVPPKEVKKPPASDKDA